MPSSPKDLESQGYRRIAGALWIRTEPQGNVDLADGLHVLRIQRADALTVLEELDKAVFGGALDVSPPPPATEAEARARLAAAGIDAGAEFERMLAALRIRRPLPDGPFVFPPAAFRITAVPSNRQDGLVAYLRNRRELLANATGQGAAAELGALDTWIAELVKAGDAPAPAPKRDAAVPVETRLAVLEQRLAGLEIAGAALEQRVGLLEIGADGEAAADLGRYGAQEPVIPLDREVVGIQSTVGDSEEQRLHDERHGIKARHYLTMLSSVDTDWIVSRVRSQIEGRVVVEIGAGVGVLACELAKYAKQVYAIEANLPWSWAFMRHLYGTKPANLTWLVGAAQSMVDVIRADVAIVVTGSDEVGLRELAGRFAPTVIMPWQDWNEGKAIVRWSPVGSSTGTSCQCLYGCVMQGAPGELLPGSSCQLRASGVRDPAMTKLSATVKSEWAKELAQPTSICNTCGSTGLELIDCAGSAGYRPCPNGCPRR